MLELIEPVLAFLFLFLLPMLAICSIPALLVGGVLVNMTDNEESK